VGGRRAGWRAGVVERLEAMTTAEEVRRRLQTITDALPVLIAYVDRDQCYRYVSRAYEDWIGLRPDEIVGRSVREILGEAGYELVRPHLVRALAGEHAIYEAQIPYANGVRRWVRVTYVPQRSPRGEVEGLVGLIVDISSQKQAEQAREALVTNLERTVAFSERFVRILGHDLRNPLGAIKTSAELAARRGGPETARQMDRIVRSAERMSRMISQLLDFTRARIGGGIPLTRVELDLSAR